MLAAGLIAFGCTSLLGVEEAHPHPVPDAQAASSADARASSDASEDGVAPDRSWRIKNPGTCTGATGTYNVVLGY